MLPKSPRNWNVVWKLLLVQLFAARCCELYSLWTTLPSGALLWGCVFFCAFLLSHVSAVLWSHWLAKMTDMKEQRICVKFCFKLSKMAWKHTQCLKKYFFSVFQIVLPVSLWSSIGADKSLLFILFSFFCVLQYFGIGKFTITWRATGSH